MSDYLKGLLLGIISYAIAGLILDGIIELRHANECKDRGGIFAVVGDTKSCVLPKKVGKP